MTTEPMTKERLAEIRSVMKRELSRMVAETDPPTWEYDTINDMLADNARLRAENERLTTAIRDMESEAKETHRI